MPDLRACPRFRGIGGAIAFSIPQARAFFVELSPEVFERNGAAHA